MKLMRISMMVLLTGLGALSVPVHAQSTGLSIRGIRIEANAGGERYGSSGTHRTKFGYGGTIGADAEISSFVIGVEGSYWRDSETPTNCLGGGTGTFCNSA